MAETLIGVSLGGSFDIAIQESTSTNECVCVGAQPATSFSLALQTESRWGDAEASSRRMTVTSPAAFVALPVPTVGAGYDFLGRLLYFRSLETQAVWTLRVDFATSATADIPVVGSLLLEPPEGDEILAVSIQGTGAFEWAIVGRVVESD